MKRNYVIGKLPLLVVSLITKALILCNGAIKNFSNLMQIISLSVVYVRLFGKKTDLLAWLNALSDEAKQKQEWRYWMAKTTAQASDKEAKQHLEALSKERGFYPMLAAVKLGQSYKLEMPKISQESNIQEKYTTELAEVAELRQLDRLGAAKQRWRSLLEKITARETTCVKPICE